jgi:hypothetical protein
MLEVFIRNEQGLWVLLEAAPGETLNIACIGCTVDVAALYNRLDQIFPAT